MTRARDAKTGRYIKIAPSGPLTAAAAVLPSQSIDELPSFSKNESLQQKAWRLWRILGVLNFPTSFKAKQVGRLGWDVEVDGTELEPDAALNAVKAITQPLSIAEAARRLALNLEVAGEVFYARKADEWHVYAKTTPKLKELLKASDIVVRGWQADPEAPNEAWSSILASLGTADQIRLMSALSRSQDRNRVSQRGMFLRPKEVSFPEGDDFEAKLEASMMAPIANEYSASAVVPPVFSVPAEFIDKFVHVTLDSPYDDRLMDRIDKTVHQFALEIDAPPEMLLGNMDSNHWNAWLSSEENYRAFVGPLGTLIGEVFANAMMQAVDGSVKVIVTPNPSELLARRSTVADAFDALKLGVVGFEYVRDAIGADEDDAPTPEEIATIIALTGHRVTGADVGVVNAPAMPSTTPTPSTNGSPVKAAIEETHTDALDELSRQLVAIDVQLLGTLKGASAIAVENARTRIDGEEVGAQERVTDAMKGLGRVWKRELAQARGSLRALGIEAKGPEWDRAAEASVELLVDGMTDFTTENLDKPDPEMPMLPVLLLRQVIAVAGGSGSATVAALPPPTFADPQGFAVGVLSLRDMKKSGVQIVQWRFRYGPLHRENPFLPHKEQDGRFANTEGEVHGWFPGDHKGCECFLDPVLRLVRTPTEA